MLFPWPPVYINILPFTSIRHCASSYCIWIVLIDVNAGAEEILSRQESNYDPLGVMFNVLQQIRFSIGAFLKREETILPRTTLNDTLKGLIMRAPN